MGDEGGFGDQSFVLYVTKLISHTNARSKNALVMKELLQTETKLPQTHLAVNI
jgi:hypothetical protein